MPYAMILNLRPVLFFMGIFLTALSGVMVIPVIVDAWLLTHQWSGFALSAFLTAFVGVSLILINRGYKGHLNIRHAFLLASSSWVVLSLFGALPFMFTPMHLGFTDSFFESVSGLTTTGSTVITGLDTLSPGILLWRSLLQGLGGIGTIILAVTVFPMLKIGGMQFFRSESTETSEGKVLRIAQIARTVAMVYGILLACCTLALCMAGMGFFDAVCHALATISTGGFSTHDESIGYFKSVHIEVVLIFFMVLSSLPFLLYANMVQGNILAIIRDTQVQWFIVIGAFATMIVIFWQYFHNHVPLYDALRHSLFSVTTVLTTTGFVTVDYSTWGNFMFLFIFMIPVIGGCTGSTTGGIKIFRFQVLFGVARSQIRYAIQPHGVFHPTFNRKTVPDSVVSSVMGMFVLFSVCFLVITTLLSYTDLDFNTSMSATVAALTNTGTGLGSVVGPSGSYEPLPDISKWLLIVAMLLGRLEIFTVLVLFTPYFWKD